MHFHRWLSGTVGNREHYACPSIIQPTIPTSHLLAHRLLVLAKKKRKETEVWGSWFGLLQHWQKRNLSNLYSWYSLSTVPLALYVLSTTYRSSQDPPPPTYRPLRYPPLSHTIPSSFYPPHSPATMSTESTEPSSGTTSSELQYYTCDPVALDALRKSCPWKDDPAYFKKVSLSPSSVVKMVRRDIFLRLLPVYADILEYLWWMPVYDLLGICSQY